MRQNVILQNFVRGEVSPRVRGRFDSPVYQQGCRKLKNFIPHVSGALEYRPGFKFVSRTSRGLQAVLYPFTVSETDAFILEFTNERLRILDSDGYAVARPTTAITAINKSATYLEVVSAGHGVLDGQRVYISGIVGTTTLNGRYFYAGNIAANSFRLYDVFGAYTDPDEHTTYTSGGTVEGDRELVTKYRTEDLSTLRIAPTGATAIIVNPHNDIYALVYDPTVLEPWTLSVAQLENDPFATSDNAATLTKGSQTVLVTTAELYVPPTYRGLRASATLTPGAISGTGVAFTASAAVFTEADVNRELWKIGAVGELGHGTITAYVSTTQVTVSITAGFDNTSAIVAGNWGITPPPATGVQLEDVRSTTPTGDADWEALAGTRYITEATATPGSFYLKNSDGTYLDTSAYSTHTTVLTRAVPFDKPMTAAFYENRLVFGGTLARPATVFMSAAPSSDTGSSQYFNFTGGTDDSDALFFTLSPINGVLSSIRWLSAGLTQLLAGAYGGVYRITGSGDYEAITPTSILARPSDAFGCEGVCPVSAGRQTYFVQRGASAIKGYFYDGSAEEAEVFDVTEHADHLFNEGATQLAYRVGVPDTLWAVRGDGILLSASINLGEKVVAWARYELGGEGKVVSVAVAPDGASDKDVVWAVVRRTINSSEQYYVERLSESQSYPDPEDYFGEGANEAADLIEYKDNVFIKQILDARLDCHSIYDGAERGLTANAALTVPVADPVGTTRTWTASNSVFTAADIGSKIFCRDLAMGATGAAEIWTVNSGTSVFVRITEAFTTAGTMAAGKWAIAPYSIGGLDHLEGESVTVVADGIASTKTVTDGSINYARAGGYAVVGLPYEGFVQTQNIEMSGLSGPTQSKRRNIVEIRPRFLYTLGGEYGTALYSLVTAPSLVAAPYAARPSLPFSGIARLPVEGRWNMEQEDVTLFFRQAQPYPCTIQYFDIFAEVLDE